MLTAFFYTLLRILKGGGRLDCQQLTPIFAGQTAPGSLSILLPQKRRR